MKKNLSLRKLLGIIAIIGVVSSTSVSAFASDVTPVESNAQIKDNYDDDIMIIGMDLDEGDVSTKSGWSKSMYLHKNNGKYLNFWIRNTGNTDIEITINGNSERILKPGEQGHITLELTSIFTKSYLFKAVSASNISGNISFEYKIAQRDS